MHSPIKRNVLRHKINTKKIQPGLVTSYDIRPGNEEDLFLFQRLINLSLAYLLTAPGPTMGYIVARHDPRVTSHVIICINFSNHNTWMSQTNRQNKTRYSITRLQCEYRVCVCVSLCTTVVHNTAQNSSDNCHSYPPDNHHSLPGTYVYRRAGAVYCIFTRYVKMSIYGHPIEEGRPLYFCHVVSSCIFFSRLISAIADWMSAILPHMVWPYWKFKMQIWNLLHAARWKFMMQTVAKKSPSGHHRTTLSGYIFTTKLHINNRKKTC